MISMGRPPGFASFSANDDGDEFVFMDSQNCEEGKICLPFKVNPKRKNWYDYRVFILRNDLQVENSIFQVFLGGATGERIGWITPVISVDSKEHSYAENPHYQAYAYVAMMAFLNRTIQGQIDITVIPNEADVYKFEEFFQPNMALFIISNKTLKNPFEFDLEDYIISLAQYGYTYCDLKRNPFSCFPVLKNDGVKIYISQISPQIKNKKFVVQLLARQVILEDDPTLSFFYMYQIIELMIGGIFDYKKTEAYKRYNLTENSSDGKDILDEYGEWSKEKIRINALFTLDFYPEMSTNHELLMCCNNLLVALNKKAKPSIGYAVYSVRNIVFHNYHIIDNVEYIRKIAEELVLELIRLTSSFAIPVSDFEKDYCI